MLKLHDFLIITNNYSRIFNLAFQCIISQTAQVKVINDLLIALDTGLSMLVLLDPFAAFDTIDQGPHL